MKVEYATVGNKALVVIPAEFRRKLHIREGTRLAFVEKAGRLSLHPMTDEFI